MSEIKDYTPIQMGEAYGPVWYQFEAPQKNGVVLLARPDDTATGRLLCQPEAVLRTFSILEQDERATVYADPDDNETRATVKVFNTVEEGAAVQGTFAHVRAHLAAERGLKQMAPISYSWDLRMPQLRGVFLPDEVKDNKQPVRAAGTSDNRPLWVLDAVEGSQPDEIIVPRWRPLPTSRAYNQHFKGLANYYGDGRNGYVTQLLTELSPPPVRIERLPRRLTRGSLVVANCIQNPF